MLTTNIQFSYLKNGLWNSFSGTSETSMDGIKIQTPANSSYYLKYRTWNSGKTNWYSRVDSNTDDYAGAPNRPIQRLQIQVYQNDGTKLTENIVVMYRARVAGRWLPWVSNADPEWMHSVHTKYNLDGNIDTDSYYAGNDGQDMDGIEIRVYEEGFLGDFTGGEVGATSLQYMTGSLDNWQSFDNGIYSEQIDGIKIQTSTAKGYYLQYRSKNEGKTDWYPFVKSTGTAYNDYAGYPGKPIQLLEIQAYKNDGTKLRSGVIVMYRVSIAGRWLPWVSNADPEWMLDMQNKHSLGGTLSVNSTYAGNEGQTIDGVEIRIFEDDSINAGSGGSVSDLPGSESSAELQYMTDSLSNWTSFTNTAINSHIDGIKIKTDSSKPYYLSYRSWNSGKDKYYPYVDSRGTAYNDYAGYPGKPIQLLNIYVYQNNGTKLRTGVVVMYRVRVAGRWLPWVSNANPEWMRSVQEKYDLGGTLDTKSTYAGNKGQNIDGVEIHIFEENNTNGGTITPVGKYKIIQNVPYISQVFSYPTGCESVSTVMALKYAGIDISVDTFIDNYLDKKISGVPFDPDLHFGGDPRGTAQNGNYGCYSLVILTALSKFADRNRWSFLGFRGKSLDSLCTEYIDKNIPVILWATTSMRTPYKSRSWLYGTKQIQWISPMHCLLLIGYDDTHYIFNDPQEHALTYYSKESVEQAYNGLGKQSIVISADPLVSSDEYNAGVRTGIFEGKTYFDYTIPLNNLLKSAKQRSESHRCLSWSQYCEWAATTEPIHDPQTAEHAGMQIGSFLWFFKQVNHNAEWDIKRVARWKEALPFVPYLGLSDNNDNSRGMFLFRGKTITAEDMGNILYGYAGRAIGFSAVTLYWGGGVAAKNSLTHPDLRNPDKYYGDAENDHNMIEFGYSLFEADYPNYPAVGFEGIPTDEIARLVGEIILG